MNLNREVKRFCEDKKGTVPKEMNSGSLQASHISEEENGAYNDIPTNMQILHKSSQGTLVMQNVV